MDAAPLAVEPIPARDVQIGDVLISNTLVGPRACLVVQTQLADEKVSLRVLDARTWQWSEGECNDQILTCAAGTKLGRQKRRDST